MHDHLKDAAVAAAMADDEIIRVVRSIGGSHELTDLQQAILDEFSLRGLSLERKNEIHLNRQTRAM